MTPERKAELLKRAERFAYSLTNPSEVGQLSRDVLECLDALDAAERRAAEAEGDTALLKRWGTYSSLVRETGALDDRESAAGWARKVLERALALASVATGGQGGEGA